MKHLYPYSLILIFLLMRPCFTMGQNQDSLVAGSEIIQDARVDLLVKKHIQINQAIKTMDGFRIQLFSDSGNNSKTAAQAVQDEFLAKYPETGVYLTFKSPNYKVRIGDFRTRLDAQRFLNELAVDFPNAFIIADLINLPKVN
jgi:hypothetical protein